MKLYFERPQADAFEAVKPGQTIGIGWGRGSGKSWFLRLLWYLMVAEWDHRLRPGDVAPRRYAWSSLMADLQAAPRNHLRA